MERKRDGEVDRWRQGNVWGGNTDMGQLCYLLAHLHVHETGWGVGGRTSHAPAALRRHVMCSSRYPHNSPPPPFPILVSPSTPSLTRQGFYRIAGPGSGTESTLPSLQPVGDVPIVSTDDDLVTGIAVSPDVRVLHAVAARLAVTHVPLLYIHIRSSCAARILRSPDFFFHLCY